MTDEVILHKNNAPVCLKKTTDNHPLFCADKQLITPHNINFHYLFPLQGFPIQPVLREANVKPSQVRFSGITSLTPD